MATVAVENCEDFLVRKPSWVDTIDPITIQDVVKEMVDGLVMAPFVAEAVAVHHECLREQSNKLTASDIYCRGELLHTVQMARVFPDSKTFVDMKVRDSPEIAVKHFRDLMNRTNNQPTRAEVEEFINVAFESGNELELWTPSDWIENPAFVRNLQKAEYRNWALSLNKLWKDLGRKMKDDVRVRPEMYSLIYVPNGFIIPGGRFKELYYWDTYWIIKGLLLCDMADTVKGVIENLLYLVKTLGFVPNGSRVYYEQRSQPPLLIAMVRAYYEHTKDRKFIEQNIDILHKEFEFWNNNAMIEVAKDSHTYRLARYFFPSNGPRPESYWEDFNITQELSEEDRQYMYWELKSGAASGWDFSSRWFMKNRTVEGDLRHLKTSAIIPVDLNAFLYGAARDMQFFYALLEKRHMSTAYGVRAEALRQAIENVLWSQEEGIWFDWDIINNKHRSHFYGSNFAPLWTDCYDKSKTEEIAMSVVKYIERSDVLSYRGGSPTSLIMSGEQWDFPNCWAPLQALLIQGLQRTKQRDATDLAQELATRWVNANFRGWQDRQQMYEKYDAENIGVFGGGGEYEVQAGFGWTNGFALELLSEYFSENISPEPSNAITGSASSTDKNENDGSLAHNNVINTVFDRLKENKGLLG